jgi:DNA invertase Pin-like site-specific DNA recombinase
MAIVDIYCRVATAGSNSNPNMDLEEQEAACRAYCEERGLLVGMVHSEVASGAIYRDREQLSVLRRRYRTDKTQGVVITSIDRLSRSSVHQVILLEEMKQHGTEFYCLDSYIIDPLTKMSSRTQEFVKEVEREKALDTFATEPKL